jgi:hypothetical protein
MAGRVDAGYKGAVRLNFVLSEYSHRERFAEWSQPQAASNAPTLLNYRL